MSSTIRVLCVPQTCRTFSDWKAPSRLQRISAAPDLSSQSDSVIHFDRTRAVEPPEPTGERESGEQVETFRRECRTGSLRRELAGTGSAARPTAQEVRRDGSCWRLRFGNENALCKWRAGGRDVEKLHSFRRDVPSSMASVPSADRDALCNRRCHRQEG